jgi:hypothetical protein
MPYEPTDALFWDKGCPWIWVISSCAKDMAN